MSLTRLDEVELPFNEDAILGSKEDRRDYFKKLIMILNEFVQNVVEANHLQIDISDANIRYFGTKNQSGEYPNGTFRIITLGSDNETYLEIQKKVSGDWVKIAKHSD